MLIHYCCILYLILYLLLVFNDLLTINSTNADIDRLTQVVQFPPKLNWSQFKSESVRPFSINASPALRVAESRNPDQLSRGGVTPWTGHRFTAGSHTGTNNHPCYAHGCGQF